MEDIGIDFVNHLINATIFPIGIIRFMNKSDEHNFAIGIFTFSRKFLVVGIIESL